VERFVLLKFLNPKRVVRAPWMGDQPIAKPLPTQIQTKRRQTAMPLVGFEPTIPAFDSVATVIGNSRLLPCRKCYMEEFECVSDKDAFLHLSV
jgi:hypothetical protein